MTSKADRSSAASASGPDAASTASTLSSRRSWTTTNRFVAMYNNGTGGFPTRQQLPTDAFPLGVFAADLDGDGDIDASSSNYSGASVGVYLNNGAGQYALQVELPVDRSGSYTWAHDLDGDGDLDLSVVDEETDSLYVYYNGAAPVSVRESDRSAVSESPLLMIAPNPVHAGQAVGMSVRGVSFDGDAGNVTIDVTRADGRRVRRIALVPAPHVRLGLLWDGRDDAGRVVAPGRYEIRVGDGRASVSRSVVVIR